MTYKAFDIVIVPFPFVDSHEAKVRPALVLSTNTAHKTDTIVLAMITSAQHTKKQHDTPIAHLAETGLSAQSIIRMKIFSLDTYIIYKKIGTLHANDQRICKKNFRQLFSKFCE